MQDKKLCKLCKEPIPKLAIHALNKIAIREGFCSWICISMKIGRAKAMALINKHKGEAVRSAESREKMHENASDKRGGRF
jgi:hypothetical protein